ncbi:hypothetical protein niasHT_038598 [Heterodera trifolii]|uniref:Uncharacterized protein n=1 Tax=Heterodera trifolii TaxID=157864 RepID=A0ABD2I6K7_9BILA
MPGGAKCGVFNARFERQKSHLTTTLPTNCPTSTTDKALQHIDNNTADRQQTNDKLGVQKSLQDFGQYNIDD